MTRFKQTVLSLLVLFSFGAFSVHAQESEELIRQQESTVDQQQDIKKTYQAQLAAYREDEKAYTLASQGYEQLQTLSALEKKVQTGKKLLQTRTDVLLSFVSLLKLQLIDTHGLPLDAKNLALSDLDSAYAQLGEYQNQLQQVSDKTGVEGSVEYFSLISPEIESSIYQGMGLVAFGRMQSVHDKTKTLIDDLETEFSTMDETTASQKQRGIDEINSQMNGSKSNLDEMIIDFVEVMQNKKITKSTYNSLLKDLSESYSAIKRVHTQVEELM